jgi:hypothetical protein
MGAQRGARPCWRTAAAKPPAQARGAKDGCARAVQHGPRKARAPALVYNGKGTPAVLLYTAR